MSKMGAIGRQLLGIVLGGACVLGASCATAQITPDRTLPTNSNITINGSVFNITGGTQAGRNLFHSFQQFSVPTGGTAAFNNATDIQNIFGRVTGGVVSNIDGLIRANGTANLFLINPNGIVFGPNASLNVGGSFVGTTANAIQFGNLGFFSATNPEAPSPLLIINPSALLFNQFAAAPIQNNSTAPAQTDPAGFRAYGLRVPDGKSLLLVGGNINMDGGQLNAYGGRVELGGLAARGFVGLNIDGDKLSLDFPASSQRADISLNNGAAAYVEAGDGGEIAVNARNLEVTKGSVLSAGIGLGLGNAGAKAGDITLNATGDIKIDGNVNRIDIINNVRRQGIGNGGSIIISSNSFFLTNGAQLDASTFGQGSAGNVIINATKSVSLDGRSAIFSTIGNVSDTPEQRNAIKGNGGDIQITSPQFSLTNGSQLSASTFGQGNTGNVIINATKSVSLDAKSAIFSTVGNVSDTPEQRNAIKGNGGDIQITSPLLSLTNGAQSVASTFGQGNAGNVIINATKSVSLDGRSNIFSNVGNVSDSTEKRNAIKGNGGDIQITTPQFSLTNGSQLSASTFGQSNAGNITVNALDAVSLAGNAGILSTVEVGGVGKGGNININAATLSLIDGARLAASTFGQGDAGNVTVNALDAVSLANAEIFSRVEAGGVGKGGNININAATLSLIDGAQLQTATRGATDTQPAGRGNAGDIIVNARDRVFLSKGAQIFDGIQQEGVGIGGTIRINTGSLSISERSAIRTASGQQKAGDIIINARDQVSLDNDSEILSVADRGDGGNISINTRLLSIVGGAQLSTYTFGPSKAGDILIDARDHVSFEGGSSRASGAVSEVGMGAKGQGGNIAISSGSLVVDHAEILAHTFGEGNAGNVIINARDQVALSNIAFITDLIEKSGNAKGGDIRINTGTLKVTNVGRLQAATLGKGNAGNIVINARDSVEFAGSSDNGQLSSRVFTQVQPGAVGNSGNVEITTGSLFLRDGANLSASTNGNGNAGNVIINARNSITFDRSNASSGLASSSAVGQGGNVLITTGSLELLNGSQIDASTLGNGNAGNVAIVATQPINVTGTGDNGRSSAIFSTTGDNPTIPGTGRTIVGTGKGGNITITAPALSVNEGAVIDARTFNDQQGGNINLTLGTLQLLNGGQIFTTSESSGSAGTLTINANQGVTIAGKDVTYASRLRQFPNRIVQISPYSSLSVRSTAMGTAGNIILNTPRLKLDNQGIINAESNAVDGGNITLNTDLLLLRRNSTISATAGLDSKAGNGGNITINARNGFIVALPEENSDITANAFTGTGGRVQINTQRLFGIQSRFQLTPFSDITASSERGVAGTVQIRTPDIDPNRGLITLPTVTEVAPRLVSSSCAAFTDSGGSKFTVTGRSGLPPSPDEPLTSDVVWTDTRLPVTTAQHQHKTHVDKPKPQPIAIIPQYGSVKTESVIDDVKMGSLNSLSSTSVLWFFRAKL
ncbi:MAG: filamentous hemagglutinin N-terminal domain-containing protein [Rhizonema sp. PD38]|nr:filamentous hemagglutinin N-terminal domain-containing protein [Rhizonema sp. PD38]